MAKFDRLGVAALSLAFLTVITVIVGIGSFRRIIGTEEKPAAPTIKTSARETARDARSTYTANHLPHLLASCLEGRDYDKQLEIKKALYVLDFMNVYENQSKITHIKNWNQSFFIHGANLWSKAVITVPRLAWTTSDPSSFAIILETGAEPQTCEWLSNCVQVIVAGRKIPSIESLLSPFPFQDSKTCLKWVLTLPLDNNDFGRNDELVLEILYGKPNHPVVQKSPFSVWSELGAAYYPNGIQNMEINFHIADEMLDFKPLCLAGGTWEIHEQNCPGAVVELMESKDRSDWRQLTGWAPTKEGWIRARFSDVSFNTAIPMLSFRQKLDVLLPQSSHQLANNP